ncbi:hypothetical protein M514_08270 [Trichuris suis]|uniref:Uncharacterized protein n=1 Tax=Trichuris suis TaxID=68888 RepID=A0A085M0T6_9BILA|nr:hypothetical protein M513_08270 [Trichuris suis]KFD68912.1 hypothetical protein M514_08270 [Trichuris suis]KHJ46573.1 hypothetical protein D918_02887 [Trichuris suis]
MVDPVVELFNSLKIIEDASKLEEACNNIQRTFGDSNVPLTFGDFRAFDLIVDLFLELQSHRLRSIILTLLVNGVSTKDAIAERLVNNERFVVELFQKVRSYEDPIRPLYGSLAANLSRKQEWCEKMSAQILDIPDLISILAKPLLDSRSTFVDTFACILVNLTQLHAVRQALLTSDREGGFSILNFIPCIKYGLMWQKTSVLRIMHNCCMDPLLHQRIVSIKDAFVTELVYPFIGDGDFTSSERDEIYPEWHVYLTVSKEREGDCEFRVVALEGLYQLCNSSAGRVMLRSMGVYYILREYHKWETNKEARDLCERTVGLLIQTEEEINCDILTSCVSEQDS